MRRKAAIHKKNSVQNHYERSRDRMNIPWPSAQGAIDFNKRNKKRRADT
jgi:hypothetical protein